jgi:hypothetical protein
MPSGEIFFLSLLLSLLPVSVPQYGCTVPTSRNYNASAALDDGSCICETRAEPRGDTCTPSSVVVSRREGEDLCPAARPLPCMMCDPSNKNCIYQCETADGLQCSKLGLETKLFISNEAVTKEINVALVVVLALLVTVSVCIHSLGWRWLQESMAWILVGMGLGLSVHLYAQLSAGTDTAEKFFEEHIEFKGWIFFYLLLPPIICDAGYHLKRSRFFRNIDRCNAHLALTTYRPNKRTQVMVWLRSILMLSVVGTVISTIVIGATLYFVDLGVLPGIDASRGPGALNPGPWCAQPVPCTMSTVCADRRPPWERGALTRAADPTGVSDLTVTRPDAGNACNSAPYFQRPIRSPRCQSSPAWPSSKIKTSRL